ncbi:TauD/TfdA family dioxygenase [Streptomyces sp. NBC_00557]|uniref:TauD/TfdA family dioxygenase n=1 Tax=Streptomyces sp. NBC_00557 TaxID=2975776 RepID=UPI002E82204B|nr:TauD/TfdA family dioxygenase [Streptomyces sp. NBC_00557]WUC36118.1 TauD/TfdA family dioxygenase [Streptomyces sp. NBC_00557]
MTTYAEPRAELAALTLEPAEAALLDELLREVTQLPGPLEQMIQTEVFASFAERLPGRLRAGIESFRDTPPDHGLLVVRGLPVGDIPATPAAYGANVLGERHASSLLVALVAHPLGGLIGYEDEKSGALVHDVYPVAGDAAKPLNSGSTLFDFHTENVHHPVRPSHLGLLCLRPDHDRQAATMVASVREAEPLLTAADRELLRTDRYRSRFPLSFTRGLAEDQRPVTEPHPVLMDGPADAPGTRVRFNMHNTFGTDPEAQAALERLNHAMHTVHRAVRAERGDLLLVDNRIVVHGRSDFTPRYDGDDRWLRRFYPYPGELRADVLVRAGGRVLGKDSYARA